MSRDTAADPAKGPGVTIIVAAKNEERLLAATVRTVLSAVPAWFTDWEVLLMNDGSTDRTGPIADELAADYERVFAHHHPVGRGPGGAFHAGLALSRMPYVILVNGKDDTPKEALDKIFALRGQADMVVPYTLNSIERELYRRAISWTFTTILNVVFGLRLRYYNHSVLHRTALVRGLDLRTTSYAYQAEALIKLLKAGHDYVEVGVLDRFDFTRRTRAFSLSNFWGVGRFFLGVLRDIYMRRLGRRAREPEDVQ